MWYVHNQFNHFNTYSTCLCESSGLDISFPLRKQGNIAISGILGSWIQEVLRDVNKLSRRDFNVQQTWVSCTYVERPFHTWLEAIFISISHDKSTRHSHGDMIRCKFSYTTPAFRNDVTTFISHVRPIPENCGLFTLL